MDSKAVEIILALISVIATLIGGTGTTLAVKKKKSLERELGELKATQAHQNQINADFKNDLQNLDRKIDEIKNILIESKGEISNGKKTGIW